MARRVMLRQVAGGWLLSEDRGVEDSLIIGLMRSRAAAQRWLAKEGAESLGRRLVTIGGRRAITVEMEEYLLPA